LKKSPEQIQRIGIIANAEKPASRKVVREAVALISRTGRAVLCDDATAAMSGLKNARAGTTATLAREVDLLVVCGGDGTMLRAVREIDGERTPIFGINVGRLGFLTAVPSQKLKEALASIWAGDFVIENRSLIQAGGTAQGKAIRHSALNDIVISRGAVSRMIELDVHVNDSPLTRYRCDGLIVSTPTGSTAYSLSAGGAIISPDAEVFAITPICPHTLSNRSVIVGMDSTISVKVMSEKVHTTVSADGQVHLDLAAGDVVTVRRSRSSVQLLHLVGTSFFETVRRKLNWSGSNV
jgi:NAD+ kinase